MVNYIVPMEKLDFGLFIGKDLEGIDFFVIGFVFWGIEFVSFFDIFLITAILISTVLVAVISRAMISYKEYLKE